jgi:hypothetical protein
MTKPERPQQQGWIHGEWAGLIALVLALGVAISMVTALVGTMLSDEPISSEKASLLSTLTGAAIGVIGTYIGAHGRGGRRTSDAPSEDERREPR